jgi:alginate O-acetyltransferase complex protein AlgJ
VVTTETSTLARADARPAPTPRRSWRLRRPLGLVIAIGFFFGPLGAFVLGARPQAFENHALADLPALSEGWSFFPAFTTWAVDHLPLRQQAVQAYAAGSERVFAQPPSYGSADPGPVAGVPSGDGTVADTGDGVEYPSVIQGTHDWLYYGADIAGRCEPIRSIDDTLDRIDRLGAAVEASGRRFVFTVAPDKTTIYPDNMPESYVGADCAEERRTAFWDALRITPPTGYLDLRGPLEAEQERSGPIYRPTDTHWSPRGAAVYTRELAGRLDPVLLEDTDAVETGTARVTGDLAAMLGLTTTDAFTAVEIRRPGLTPIGRNSLELPLLPLAAPVTANTSTVDAPLFQPRTLLLGDSFTDVSLSPLGTVFADVSLLHNEAAATAPQVAAEAIADADVVVFEIVERSIGIGGGALIDDASLAAIEQALARSPR